ncbi:hypothetical protein [Fusobacterium sp. PH5-44]|uniref:hypothetical protein n=1 Tax=unclassified Fusobacterium TaxID=2648384 RepID=UPI003D240BA8
MKRDKEKLSIALARKCMGNRDYATPTKFGEATIVRIKNGNQTIGKITKVLEVGISEIIEYYGVC